MGDKGNILVTGGAGFIGSHVCKALAAGGYTPVTFDNLSRGNRWAVRWGPLVIGDLGNSWQVGSALEEYEPAAVMHFAALAYVGESVSQPEKYYYNNVVGSLNLIDAALSRGVDKLVFSSTCATYGVPDVALIDENQPQHPVNPYGNTKLAVERIIQDLGRARALRSVVLRYFNAAGADPESEIGESHDPETHAIPLAILTALGKVEKFEIYGNDYRTEDGSAVRDYIHVTDLAEGHVLALEHLLAGGPSIALNLGTGAGHSVKEIVSSVERVSGRSLATREANRRPGDPPVLVADPSQAKRVLGWVPRLTELDQIVRTAFDWYVSREA